MGLDTGRVGKRRVVRLGIEHADQDPGMFPEIVAVAPHKLGFGFEIRSK